MAYVPVEALEVRLWGKTIGAVALDPGTRYLSKTIESVQKQLSL